MPTSRLWSLTVCLTVALTAAWLSARAEPDDLQQAWLDRMAVSHRWDNVEGAPTYLQGARPTYRHGAGLHLVHLEPGHSVTLAVAEGESALARSPGRELAPVDLDFAWSNGSGLYQTAPVSNLGHGGSLMSSAPGRGQTVLKITRPRHSLEPLEVALFISRRLRGLVTVKYRELLRPEATTPAIALLDEHSVTEFWSSGPGQPLTLDIEGPLRIEVRSRLSMPEGDRSVESYRGYAYLDAKLWRVLNFETALETDQVTATKGCIGAVGRIASAYLDVPDGKHRLQVRFLRPVYARLLAAQRPDDYLFDGNRPEGYTRLAEAAMSSAAESGFWTETGSTGSGQKDPHPAPSGARAYRGALQVAENNGYRGGGLAAAMALDSRWPQFPAHGASRSMVARRLSLHTFYRPLLPEAGSGEAVYAWFETPRWRRTQKTPPVIPWSHARSLLQDLPGGYFAPLAGGWTQRLRYALPERSAPSYLRVAVARPQSALGTSIYVQFDQDEPFELQVLDPADAGAPQSSSASGAALLVQAEQHRARGATLSGPFAADRRAAPLTAVEHLELDLPRQVRSVTVWQAPATTDVWVTLAYRAGKPFKRSENDILALLDAIGATKTLQSFSASLQGLQHAPVAPTSAKPQTNAAADPRLADLESDLRNQWQPLLRLMRSRLLQFSADVESPSPHDLAGTNLADQKLAELRERAVTAAAAGDWLRALETWGVVHNHSSGASRTRARLEQVTALQQLGNAFLSDRLLREALLYAPTATQRQEAFQRLLKTRERARDLEGILTLTATVAILDPRPRRLRRLAQALVEVGETRNALLVLLALPEAQRPRELMLRASYLERWWRVFDGTLAELENETERLRWQGYRAQIEGDYDAAVGAWGRMGAAGAKLHDRLARGLAIRADLDSPDPQVRQRALERWQLWQAEGLANGRYSGEPSAIRRSQGAALLQSLDRNRIAVAHRAEFAQPLVIPVYGPARLRLTVRPLHPGGGGDEPVNDWVKVWRDSEKEIFPIIDNRPSPGLTVAGHATLAAGRGTHIEYAVPAGYHEIRLEPERNPVLVQAKLLRPELPLAVLPPLTPYTARAALDGVLGTRPPLAADKKARSRGVERAQRCPQPRTYEAPANGSPSPPRDAATAVGRPAAAWFAGVRRGSGPSVRSPRHGVVRAQPPIPPASSDEARLKRLRHWLWLAEHEPKARAGALAAAERTFAEHPTMPGAEALLRRLRRGVVWERVRTIQQSAGVRSVESAGWQPEHPSLRIRKALMKPLRAGEQLLSGFDTLVLAVENPQSASFLLELQSEHVGQQRPYALEARVAVDDQPERPVVLSTAAPRVTLLEELDKGQRFLRVRIARPMSNQYLRVRVKESRDGTQWPVAERSQRLYDVATRGEPLVAYVDGPAWLRIDEFRAGATRTSYRHIAAGPQKLSLTPPGDQPEALYRIYRQNPIEDRPEPTLRPVALSLEPLTPPPLQLPDRPTPRHSPAANGLPLGGQEDGTWSTYAAMVSRRALNDEPDAGAGNDRYFSTGLGYRYFSEHLEAYYETALRVRLRDGGEPTLAFQQWIDIRRSDWPFDLDLASSLFIQDSEAAANLKGRVSRQWQWGEKTSNRPYVSFFQRFLTLDDVTEGDADGVDQDVFTRYKRNHKRGLGLGNLTVHRLHADTIVFAGAGLTSNESLNPFDPDKVQLRLGSKQLFGAFTLGTGYSLTHYFADNDRAKSENRSKLWVDLGYLGFWSPRDGAEAKFRIQYDANAGDTSFWLSFAWHRSNGRYLRDFRPSDVDFIAERNRRALEQEAAPTVLEALESM